MATKNSADRIQFPEPDYAYLNIPRNWRKAGVSAGVYGGARWVFEGLEVMASDTGHAGS